MYLILDVVEIIFCKNLNDECLPLAGETIDFSDTVFPPRSVASP